MMFDVVIIGGSFVGLFVVLMFVCVCCEVLVIDGGLLCNCFVVYLYGVFGLDGIVGSELLCWVKV